MSMNPHRLSCAFKLACGIVVLAFALIPCRLNAQQPGQLALSTFPADTHQVSFTDLGQLRTSPDYPQLRDRLLGSQLRDLEQFLRPAGDDPEADTDAVMLGWRGDVSNPSGFFGLATGQFHPGQVLDFFKRSKLPIATYSGVQLYSNGSSEPRSRFFFAFLDDTTAIFGRLDDLKTLLDVRAGSRPALDTNASFVNWESELDGSAPQWAISTGRAAATEATLWLSGGGNVKPPADLGALMTPIKAVLFSADMVSSSDLAAHISVVCDRPETATALAQILTMWRNSHPAAGSGTPPQLANFLASLNISAQGPRVELDGMGSATLVQQLVH
ncbi:MAG TPA: hypothetical protein VG204_04965 [Terriglobia bacterium]|nr:hypothetical protein [Terriglobia bacterium]